MRILLKGHKHYRLSFLYGPVVYLTTWDFAATNNKQLVFLVPTCHIPCRACILQTLWCSETARQINTRKCFILCNSYLVACVLPPQVFPLRKRDPSPFPCSSIFSAFSTCSTEAREKAIDWTVTAPTLLFHHLLPGSSGIQPNPSSFFLM